MMSSSKDDLGSLVMGLLVLVFIGFVFVQPYFEAKSFNKLTGGNATYADAFWSELRIDGSSQILKGNQ